MIYENVLQLIGQTPLIKLNQFMAAEHIRSNLYAKVEFFNPGGSVKDRIAYSMIKQAIAEKKINSDTVIIEPTSGNTGIGIALIGASLGYRVIFTMPESMSLERRKILKAYGAELVLTPAKDGMKGAIARADELAAQFDNSFIPSQFSNPNNPLAHIQTTGPEIYHELGDRIDYLVAGVGTGGTITGLSKFLKKKIPTLKSVAVEPFDSDVLSGGNPGPHAIQGIGAGFIPQILEVELIDQIVRVDNQAAIDYARRLTKTEGLLVGISSGAALYAAAKIGKKEADQNIVVILPDTGERYLSTALFE